MADKFIVIESIQCPNCGAPVAWKDGQTLAICVYCNSSIRVSLRAGEQPVVAPTPSAEVIDEVKRLLIIGYKVKAVRYYSEQAGVSIEEADPAVTAIQKMIGYRPALSLVGFLILMALVMVSVAGVVAGIWLIRRGPGTSDSQGAGVVLIVAALVFAVMNGSAFGSSLKAAWLAYRGQPARATILKRWKVIDTSRQISRLRGQSSPIQIVRLLLEVHPEDGTSPTYITEANCMVGEKSQVKFQIGQDLLVKVDRGDPKKVVVL